MPPTRSQCYIVAYYSADFGTFGTFYTVAAAGRAVRANPGTFYLRFPTEHDARKWLDNRFRAAIDNNFDNNFRAATEPDASDSDSASGSEPNDEEAGGENTEQPLTWVHKVAEHSIPRATKTLRVTR
jgi:hypothetical protein